MTLAVQNATLTLIMHYSRVSAPPSQTYSAAAAVLVTEVLKGTISLFVAFTRLDAPAQYPGLAPVSQWSPWALLLRGRRLAREVFRADCWKLSIPAILYGKSHNPLIQPARDAHQVCQSSKIICNSWLSPTWTQQHSRSAIR